MSRRHKIHWIIVVVLAVASMIHQVGPRIVYTHAGSLDVEWRLWEWYIEDSAISFAFARSLAGGEGLTVFPGGERVEGYSNPLWVFLMAAWYLIGVDGFWSSKLMALGLGAGTVVLTYLLGREIIDDEHSDAPLIAPFTLAASAQFAFWNAAGLENPLFCFLLAGGLWRTAVEARTNGLPYAAVWYFLLSITRPEAIMYGALGGFWAMVSSLSRGRGVKPTIKWLAMFFLPFFAYHAVRYTYFAWPFPNTYYAKLGHREFRPFNWAGRGWKYARNFAHQLGAGYAIPILVAGVVTLRGGRKWFAVTICIMAAVVLLYPGTDALLATGIWPRDLPTPTWWAEARTWTLLLLAVITPLGGLGSRGWVPKAVAWGSGCTVVFFCVKSTGDWMNGFRWMNLLTVPFSALFAAGVYELTGAAQRALGSRANPLGAADPPWTTPGWMIAALCTTLVIPPNITHTAAFLGKRETGPFAVKKRVTYTASIQERIFAFDLQRNLDVDQGAHLYWCQHHMVDIAGLVDVPMAHHNFERPFIREYIFEETRPTFAHVHGGWASSSRIPTHPEWKTDYFELPGYPAGKRSFHTGNHIRRDMLMAPRWRGPKRRSVAFEGEITLEGFDVPSPEVSVGKGVFIEVAFSYRELEDPEAFRVLGFFSHEAGRLYTFDIPMGYDWLAPTDWRAEEVFVGRFAPMLPARMGEGDFDLGFVVLGPDGQVVPPTGPEGLPRVPNGAVIGGSDEVEAHFIAGEVRFKNQVHVGPPGTSEKHARLRLAEAITQAAEGRCVESVSTWNRARLHVPKATSWAEEHRPEAAAGISHCFAQKAVDDEDRAQALEYLVTARSWYHRDALLLSFGADLADELYAEGWVAREARDWEVAYRRFADTLRADPTRAWARRYAEEARDYRMKLDPETKAAEEQERQDRLERLQKQREEREAKRAREEAEAPPPGDDGEQAGDDDEVAVPDEARARPSKIPIRPGQLTQPVDAPKVGTTPPVTQPVQRRDP